MAKLNKIELSNAILTALKGFGDRASLKQIQTALDNINSRRLQRQLLQMIQQGTVTRHGNTRSITYRLSEPKTAPLAREATDTELIPLTAESQALLAHLKQPEQKRDPVGYRRDFLVSYQPNVSSYLTAAEKEKLSEIGITPDVDKPAGTYGKEILNRLLIDLSWNSSRLEGNTYSLLETERLIALGEKADDKSTLDAQMILNHKDAIEYLINNPINIGFNRQTILDIHALLSDNLLPNPASSGKLRKITVGIQKSVYMPLVIPQQVEEMFDLMLEKASAIENPFEQSFFIMVHLPYLQPFEDVNKRVSRLAANIPFNKKNLSPISFVDVPKDIYIHGLLSIYELNRIDILKDVFLWAYDRSSKRYAAVQQMLGKPDPFRLKYRSRIKSLVSEIVSSALTQKDAIALIAKEAREFPVSDQDKFTETVDTELLSLHEGNFARYMISPSEFKRWQEQWSSKN